MLSSFPSCSERHCLPTCHQQDPQPCQGPHDTPALHRACDPRGHSGPFQKGVDPGILPSQGVWGPAYAYPCCPRGEPGGQELPKGQLGIFWDWPSALISAADLVRAGVPSMGPEDSAKCLRHGPQLSRWVAGDGPAQERCGPRSLGSPALGLDTCRAWDHVDGQILGQLRPLAEEEEEEGAGATSPRGPAFPGMGSEELRLASFYDWPLTAGVPPELLAAAGFFHTGQQDKVRCFFCYGGLQSWKRGDDPWTEHAKWFPSCQFLLQSKGRDFVHSVQETRSQLLGSWDPWEEPEDAAPVAPSVPAPGDPELPTPRREVQSESAQEPGGASPAQAQSGWWVLEPPGARDAEEQLRRLQEERTCKVCLDRAVSIVFVPCGHLVCAECAPSLQLCPICRAPIRSHVRTFLS
ncbi:baculoviral IAP repeat-containing protein 7 isoform X1 [Trachypithecus francoisi]|uniref:baculoviral IAP repeat-containing protein 7 isoform X1 n=1 Tax=Trachypithecus francoisi TaxID=54180 RepID=UPI00141BB0DE|nr:baculoviral IAP repeat-containing protein 7 isoform X1 [Trachypithecus francoisi]